MTGLGDRTGSDEYNGIGNGFSHGNPLFEGSIGATQSSWTKYVVEVDSPKPFSQWDLIAECPNSTCAQVVHSNAKIGRNKVIPLTTKECLEQKEQLGNVGKTFKLEEDVEIANLDADKYRDLAEK
ncbi:hypothetical protein JHK87_006941 [Glycine soja]|nr:hypothetical protein JHK87_006941 [Glycine soja]